MARRPNLRAVQAASAAARPIGEDEPPEPKGDDELPDGCPVVALGIDGQVRYYLTADRQLSALPVREHSRLGILGLFGRKSELLYEYWPRYAKDGRTITGWRPELASERLMAACSREGPWDPAERQRGRGAWLGDNGELVLHTGDRVLSFPLTPTPWRDHDSARAGLVGRYVYSAGASVGAPAQEPATGGADGPAQRVLDVLATWQWRRPDIDPVLLLGWIGAAMIGGALKWRPMIWLTGGTGTGKSTLQELLRQVFAGGLIQTADTTPAGLWQALRHQTLPVAVDELEAEEDNRRAIGVVKLARVAASGSLMLRGGADHRGTEFVVRSAFAFSSILMPPLSGQDRNRIAVLELEPLADGTKVPLLDARAFGALGALLRRRLVDGWPQFQRTLEHYHASLRAAGHSSRAADQYGTLLACADVMLLDGEVDGELSGAWIRQLNADELTQSVENERDEARCLARLASWPVDAYRGGFRRSMAQWVRVAIGLDPDASAADGVQVLGTYGLKVVEGRFLAVANYHHGLSGIYEGSHWQGTSGTVGVWVQALRRLPGAHPSKNAIYLGDHNYRCTLLPLDLLVTDGQRRQAAMEVVT